MLGVRVLPGSPALCCCHAKGAYECAKRHFFVRTRVKRIFASSQEFLQVSDSVNFSSDCHCQRNFRGIGGLIEPSLTGSLESRYPSASIASARKKTGPKS